MKYSIRVNKSQYSDLFICVLFLLLGFTLSSQITIESTLFSDKIGKKYKDVLYETNLGITNQLSEIIQAVGPDQVYDFSSLNYVDSTEIIEEYFTVDPNDPILQDPNIAGSNIMVKSLFPPVSGGPPDTFIQYRYLTLTADKLVINASLTFVDIDMDNQLDTLLQWFTPRSLVLPFPVNSNSVWTDSTTLNQMFAGMTFASAITVDTSTAEGWGRIITPKGTVDALRIRDKSINKIPNTTVVNVSNSLFFGTSDEHLSGSIVLEDGRAFYNVRTYLDGTSSTYKIPELSFTSLQNYPNPFSNLTTIEFDLKKQSQVSIKVLSMDGSVVSHVSNEIYQAGKNSVECIADNLISSNYILEIRVNNQVQRKLMSCLK